MNSILLVAVGGAVGSIFRYLVGLWGLRLMGPAFPWGTMMVNIAGSLMIGLLTEMILRRFDGSPHLRLLLVTGLLGGFTTFSSFTLDFVSLLERGGLSVAAAYMIGSLVVSVGAVFLGIFLGRLVF